MGTWWKKKHHFFFSSAQFLFPITRWDVSSLFLCANNDLACLKGEHVYWLFPSESTVLVPSLNPGLEGSCCSDLDAGNGLLTLDESSNTADFEVTDSSADVVRVSRCCRSAVVRLVGLPRLWQSKHSPPDFRAGETLHHQLAEERGNSRNQAIFILNKNKVLHRVFLFHVLPQVVSSAPLSSKAEFNVQNFV